MAWDGSGNFTRNNGQHTGSNLWNSTHAGGRKIRTDDHDTHDEDLAEGLENCLTRTGENSPTANLPMNDKRHTGCQDAVARSDYATMGQLADRAITYVAATEVGGTAAAITLAPTPVITAYAANQSYRFQAEADCEGATTVNVSAVGAKDVQKINTTGGVAALVANDFRNGSVLEIWYDGTRFLVLRGLAASEAFSGDYDDLTDKPTIPNLGTDVTFMDVLTQAQYDAISNKSDTTLYIIIG